MDREVVDYNRAVRSSLQRQLEPSSFPLLRCANSVRKLVAILYSQHLYAK